MLEAAAMAMHPVESGALADRGMLGPLLREEPYRPVLGNPDQHVDRWRRAMDEFAAAIDAARADREAARRLMQVFTAFCRTPASFELILTSDRASLPEVRRVGGGEAVPAAVRASAEPHRRQRDSREQGHVGGHLSQGPRRGGGRRGEGHRAPRARSLLR